MGKGTYGCNETLHGGLWTQILTQDHKYGLKMLLGMCSTGLKTITDVLGSDSMSLTPNKMNFMTLGPINGPKNRQNSSFLLGNRQK